MEPFAGFEPQVGEVRAVRTFRVGPGGVLYPLFSDVGWSPGVNAARCNVGFGPDVFLKPDDHETPEPTCTCGYYAYASELAASEYPNARHVLAVVSCWGRLIAGTRGVRAQFARVEAVWMSAAVPADLVASVADQYAAATVYSDKQLMFSEHPLTVLDCYEPDSPEQNARKLGVHAAVVVAALVLGLLPHTWLSSNHNLLLAWWVTFALVLASTVVSHRRNGLVAKRQVIQSCALALWLLSPFGGAAGTFLLRLPLIQLAALMNAQRRVLARQANRFPARIAGLDQ